ncbi:MAG: PEP-CTERM sorting domain-containing protein [Pirellulales bacterium]
MRQIVVYSLNRFALSCLLAGAIASFWTVCPRSTFADEIVGNAIVPRGLTDSASGSIFTHDESFAATGTLQSWSFYHQDVGLQITPVIYELTGGQYTITGIGASRPVSGIGTHDFAFDLVAGSANVGPNSFFGWKDGGMGLNNAGTVEWTNGGGVVDWLGPGHTTFAVNDVLSIAAGALSRTYSIQANSVDGASSPVETIGNPVIDRPTVDGAVGSLFVMSGNPFTAAGSVDSWSFFNNNFVPPPPKQITPLIVEDVGGTFAITGIGQTRTSTGVGAQQYDFDLVAGSAEVGPGRFLAWKDGGNGTDNTGVAPFNENLGQSVKWFGATHTTFSAGENLGAGQAFPRTYSISATSDAIPPFESPHAVVHGQAVIDRGSTDTFHGTAILQSPIPDGSGDTDVPGKVTSWKFFNNNPVAAGLLVTPLLLENVGGQYVVRGIGSTQNVTDAGEQMHDFDLAAGTDTVDWTSGAFHIGIRYGSTTTSNTGVVDFDAGSALWTFIGAPDGAPPVVLDSPITGGQTFANLGRDYSVQFNFEPVPEPSSVLLTLCGLAIAGVVARRRRRLPMASTVA